MAPGIIPLVYPRNISFKECEESQGYTAPKQDELVERYPGAARVVRRPQPTDDVASEREDIDDDLKFPHHLCGRFLKNAIDNPVPPAEIQKVMLLRMGLWRVVRHPLRTDDVASEREDIDAILKFPHPLCGRFLKTAIEDANIFYACFLFTISKSKAADIELLRFLISKCADVPKVELAM
ncbi:PREDICTED: uncharacterized protein [Prunus dulcis]|uniref:PREDICTED: uncharacterized protein n=1 Tax=Prunus dulcis TaxID=3755 RepID=A0A5E4ES28_PRUDU|nr:hypothetical protein L3X38_014570 [Prunus dulcis]VVA18515.1 PREDICTED: uncharacterized protein [Prunus dulcis]